MQITSYFPHRLMAERKEACSPICLLGRAWFYPEDSPLMTPRLHLWVSPRWGLGLPQCARGYHPHSVHSTYFQWVFLKFLPSIIKHFLIFSKPPGPCIIAVTSVAIILIVSQNCHQKMGCVISFLHLNIFNLPLYFLFFLICFLSFSKLLTKDKVKIHFQLFFSSLFLSFHF